jgi:tetraacyldisaccharide 4''-kinase
VYRLGIKKPACPHAPVVCVGNLLAGGSGKSPISLYVAGVLRDSGREVALSCSGYGAPHSEGASLAPHGPLMAAEWGDEAAMVRWLMPELPLIVGRNRVEAARICEQQLPRAVMLMDDGFQHLPLRKHVTILLDPPHSNHACLPAGPYREPRKNRFRADLVMPNGVHSTFRISGFCNPNGDTIAIPTNPRVNVLCALGNPARFIEDLQGLGLVPDTKLLLPDHDPLTGGNLLTCLNQELPLVVTAKDWVKLQGRTDLDRFEIWIARQEAKIEPEAEFRAWLERKLDELPFESPSR